MTWNQICEEFDLDCCGYTLRKAIGSMDYHKCLACRKGWVSQKLADKRKDWSGVMKEKYPIKEDWRRVRFSDEVHWSIGPEGKCRIIREPGERLWTEVKRRGMRGSTHGLLLDITSSQTSTSILPRVRMGRCPLKYIVTRSLNLLLSLGFLEVMTLFLEKTTIQDMAEGHQRRVILVRLGKSRMA